MADMQQEMKDLQVRVRSLQEKMEVINQVALYCYFFASLKPPHFRNSRSRSFIGATRKALVES